MLRLASALVMTLLAIVLVAFTVVILVTKFTVLDEDPQARWALLSWLVLAASSSMAARAAWRTR